MKFQSALMMYLARCRPGQVVNDLAGDDGAIDFQDTYLPTGRFPFPFTTNLNGTSAPLPAGQDVAGSFTADRQELISAAPSNSTWIVFPPGIWDISLQYVGLIKGATADLTSDGSQVLQTIEGGVTRSTILATIVGSLSVFQRIERKFTMTVPKDIVHRLIIVHNTGLGTGTLIAHSNLIANRIL